MAELTCDSINMPTAINDEMVRYNLTEESQECDRSNSEDSQTQIYPDDQKPRALNDQGVYGCCSDHKMLVVLSPKSEKEDSISLKEVSGVSMDASSNDRNCTTSSHDEATDLSVSFSSIPTNNLLMNGFLQNSNYNHPNSTNQFEIEGILKQYMNNFRCLSGVPNSFHPYFMANSESEKNKELDVAQLHPKLQEATSGFCQESAFSSGHKKLPESLLENPNCKIENAANTNHHMVKENQRNETVSPQQTTPPLENNEDKNIGADNLTHEAKNMKIPPYHIMNESYLLGNHSKQNTKLVSNLHISRAYPAEQVKSDSMPTKHFGERHPIADMVSWHNETKTGADVKSHFQSSLFLQNSHGLNKKLFDKNVSLFTLAASKNITSADNAIMDPPTPSHISFNSLDASAEKSHHLPSTSNIASSSSNTIEMQETIGLKVTPGTKSSCINLVTSEEKLQSKRSSPTHQYKEALSQESNLRENVGEKTSAELSLCSHVTERDLLMLMMFNHHQHLLSLSGCYGPNALTGAQPKDNSSTSSNSVDSSSWMIPPALLTLQQRRKFERPQTPSERYLDSSMGDEKHVANHFPEELTQNQKIQKQQLSVQNDKEYLNDCKSRSIEQLKQFSQEDCMHDEEKPSQYAKSSSYQHLSPVEQTSPSIGKQNKLSVRNKISKPKSASKYFKLLIENIFA